MLDREFIEHVCDHSDRSAWNCMTLIAGKNATTTGQVLVAHNEDDNVYCKVYRGDVPQMNWQAGSVIPAENGRASIPQIEHTHGYLWVEVKAGMYGLSNADTYFNDAGILIVSNSCKVSKENTRDPSRLSNGGIEGNLRRIVAERASTAREALQIAIEMVDTYGYAPDGRSYTFADKNEAFMIQIVSGRHYMAVRIPDDMVAVMPNHYTLHGLNDFPEAYYSPDLVEYAIEKGWYKPRQDGSFEDFDFAKAYAIEEKQHQPYNVLRAKHALQKLMHQKCGNMPALPDVWAEGSVYGLKARGNFEITMNWKNGKLTEANIHSLSGKSCTLRTRQAFTVKSAGRTIATSTPVRSNGKEYFQATFETQKDGTYLITQ